MQEYPLMGYKIIYYQIYALKRNYSNLLSNIESNPPKENITIVTRSYALKRTLSKEEWMLNINVIIYLVLARGIFQVQKQHLLIKKIKNMNNNNNNNNKLFVSKK
jgi:hypothetical protein